jgi:hypothetical protein
VIVKYKLILTYLFFLVFIVPWYWPTDVNVVYFGFPLWAIISLAVALLVSILTAAILIMHRSDESAGDRD